MWKALLVVSFVVLCSGTFAIAKTVTYGIGEWSHCSESSIAGFTLRKGAWRCESLAGMATVDHSDTGSFQEPDCYRGSTPVPAEGGIKEKNGGLATEWTKRVVSFCFAGEGLYARRCDFTEEGCEKGETLSDEELERIFR